MQIALSNLDTVLLEARGVLENIGPHLLAEMEDIQKAQFYPACPPTEALSSSKADQAVLSRRPTAAASQPGWHAYLSPFVTMPCSAFSCNPTVCLCW